MVNVEGFKIFKF